MWRVLLFLALLCLAAYGAVWLANNPETIAVTWAGREYSTSLAVGVTGLVAATLLIAFVLAVLRGVVTLPFTIARQARSRKERKGRAAVSKGIVAVAAGDVAAARRHAGEAERLLGKEPLALLLQAQAAQASGDREAAEKTFRTMAERPDTRVLGLRGLYAEARRRGDAETARHYAEEAARVAPAVGWASDAVLESLSAEGDWTGAVRVIERRSSLGLMDRSTSRRQRAVLLTADALERQATDPTGALATAEQAVKLAPELVPAAVLAGRMLSERGDLKKAAKIIETAWAADPHPDLAGAYLNLRPGDSALDRLRRAETLAKLTSWGDESRLAIARTAIEARDFGKAREVVQPLLDAEERPSVRLCMTMAEIEGRSGRGGSAREWLARAARAPRDKAWIADGIVSDRWLPVSPVSGRLDAFRWETPPAALGVTAPDDLALFEPEPAAEEVPSFLPRPVAPPPAAAVDPDLALKPEPDVAAAVPASATSTTPVPEGVSSATVPAAPAPETAAAVTVEPAGSPDGKMSAGASSVVASGTIPAPAVPASTPTVKPATGPDATSDAAPSRAARSGSADPEPVIFPVRRAPDDPGLERDEDRRQRFRLRV